MDVTIKEKRENPLLQRQELFCEVSFEKAMPSRKELREAIAAASGSPLELLVIVSAKGGFGTCKAEVKAHAYKSKEAFSVERKHLLVRDGLAEKQKKSQAKSKGKK